MQVENSTIISIVLMLFSLALGMLINSLFHINNRLSEIHHAILKGEINPNKFSELKEEIIEIKGMLNILTLHRDQRDPPR